MACKHGDLIGLPRVTCDTTHHSHSVALVGRADENGVSLPLSLFLSGMLAQLSVLGAGQAGETPSGASVSQSTAPSPPLRPSLIPSPPLA